MMGNTNSANNSKRKGTSGTRFHKSAPCAVVCQHKIQRMQKHLEIHPKDGATSAHLQKKLAKLEHAQ